MSWYRRQLAEGQTFRCSSCGRIKRVKYVPTSTLCRSCAAKTAAKKRRAVPNVPVSITDNIVVTTAVENRLMTEAEKVTPVLPPFRQEDTANSVKATFWALFIIVGTFYFLMEKKNDILVWLALLGTAILLHFVIWVLMMKPRSERKKREAERLAQLVLKKQELAKQRQERIEERDQFYASPEWNMLRKQAIKKGGRICAECGRKIRKDNDITVDHIRPRSKYPDLALKIENLRVLCRSCNSRKGDREFEEF